MPPGRFSLMFIANEFVFSGKLVLTSCSCFLFLVFLCVRQLNAHLLFSVFLGKIK